MESMTALTCDLICADEKTMQRVKRASKSETVSIAGVLGTMKRRMYRVMVNLCERHYERVENDYGGSDTVEKLVPLDDIECYMDAVTGSLYRRDTGVCLSSSSLWITSGERLNSPACAAFCAGPVE